MHMKKGNAVVWVIIVIVVIALGWWLYSKNSSAPVTNPAMQDGTSAPIEQTRDEAAAEIIKVTYTSAGFTPSEITILKGQTVQFVNNTSGDMWVASAIHPTHSVYSSTTLAQHCPDATGDAFDECVGAAPGTTWSFTFNKIGTWGYHDHLHASNFGKIIVQ
jgi:plastocyanin